MSDVIIRVQDRWGRGPYRPGLSHLWIDPSGSIMLPWWEELGVPMATAHEHITDEYHNGCGFRSLGQLNAWFTQREQRTLDRYGYQLAAVNADVIYYETPTQVVFGSIKPLSKPVRACKLLSSAAGKLAA